MVREEEEGIMRGHVFVDSKTRYYGLVTTPAKNEYRREGVLHRCVLHVYRVLYLSYAAEIGGC